MDRFDTLPVVRASTRDREETVAVLCRGYSAGMLTIGELEHRSGQAFTARTISDLERIVRDLVLGHPEVAAPSVEVVPVTLAGFGRRSLALILDWGLVTAAAIALSLANPALPALPVLLYFPVAWCVGGATIAQRLFGIRVVDVRSKRKIGLMQAVSRWFALALASPYLVCTLPILWDNERQGWHDRVARTIVIRRRSR